jgi:hypothetical protein
MKAAEEKLKEIEEHDSLILQWSRSKTRLRSKKPKAKAKAKAKVETKVEHAHKEKAEETARMDQLINNSAFD